MLESSSGVLIGREPGLEWKNYILVFIRCLQPSLKSSHPEEGASSRGSTRTWESCRTGVPLLGGSLGAGSLSSASLQGRVPSILGDLGAMVSSGMAAKEIWVCAGWGHRWWSFRGCLTSVAAAALHLILVEVDGKCLTIADNIHMSLCFFF